MRACNGYVTGYVIPAGYVEPGEKGGAGGAGGIEVRGQSSLHSYRRMYDRPAAHYCTCTVALGSEHQMQCHDSAMPVTLTRFLLRSTDTPFLSSYILFLRCLKEKCKVLIKNASDENIFQRQTIFNIDISDYKKNIHKCDPKINKLARRN